MKKKRAKSKKDNYDLQVWWKPDLFQHSRQFHVLEDIQNFDNSGDFLVSTDSREQVRTVADYFNDAIRKKLDTQNLVYDPKELEKIDVKILNNERDEKIKTLTLKTNNGTKWVIGLHGWGENMYLSLHQTYLLSQLGFNVLTFDLKGHGQSYGKHGDFGYDSYKDIARIVDYLKTNHKMNHYGLIGLSSGASAALRYIQKHGHKDTQLKFVISDSAFAVFDKALSSYCKKRFPSPWTKIKNNVHDKFKEIFNFDPESYNLNDEEDMKRIANIPILFIHSKEDKIVRPQHSRELYLKKITHEKPSRSQLLIVPRASHNEALHKENKIYTQGIVSFLKNINEIT